MSLYAFRKTPAYRGADHSAQMLAALDQPMGVWSTFFDQAAGGVVESFGLGTAIRDFSIPQGTEPRPSPFNIPGMDPGAVNRLPVVGAIPTAYEALRNAVNPADSSLAAMSEDQYKASPYFRENVPWDPGMTEERAAALATFNDTRAVRDFYAQKRPITSFLGNLAGQAVDPINYIPIAGQAVRAASVARFGTVGGFVAAGALDAAANTAAFGAITRDARQSFGDDVSWQMMTTEIAMGAVIGAAFGGTMGLFARRGEARREALVAEAERRMGTLENVQQSRIALNEAIDGLANDGRVSLSPNGAAAIESMRSVPQILAHAPASEVPEGALLTTRGVYRDTRGSGTRYHGSGNEIGQLDGFAYSSLNYYGQGFYTTDAAADIAFGYANRRGATQPSIYQIEERGPINAMDMEQPVPEWLVAPERADGGMDTIAVALESNPANVRELFDEVREVGSADGLSADEIQEIFDALTYRMSEQGFNAMDHVGGVRTNKPPHSVRIYFEPDQQISINQFDPETLRVGPRPFEIDMSKGITQAPPEGIADATARVGTPERADQADSVYRVNRTTGDYVEANEIEQLRNEGRLSDDDIAFLDEQQGIFDQSLAYGRALEAAVTCII